ncbi:transcription factor DIVARICATA-like [Lolium rigidum]|uniref:transcription factor DIVARICATA-like n=1 Tax=Lolium rigidum TaxID=89674 RepID=UPI001F5DC468|nr:transcription factor DIVARICATA-like [Lolium rigidum]
MMRDAWMEVMPAMDHYASTRGGSGSGWFMPARAWTADENKKFERALAWLDLGSPDWEGVARATGKTVGEVVTHFKDLEVDVLQIESGMVPFPVYAAGGAAAAAAAFTLQWDGGHGGAAGDFRHGYRFGAGCGGGKRHGGRTAEQERKKGVPWTEEEHKLFLLGLKKYGKGDWRNISRNFVQTRTPTQVASHAQKYFIRLSSGGGKDKRRSSIHDITTVHLTDDRPPSPPSSLINQSSAPAPSSAATGQFSLPAGDTKQQQQHSGPFSSPGRTLGVPNYAMGLQDQGLQCGPLHDQLAANRSMLY